MPHSVKETLAITWCDPGIVDAKFMNGVINTISWIEKNKIKITNRIRLNGNQISRQRQDAFDAWSEDNISDWLLWVDSDIVLTPEAFKLIWDSADKILRPVVSGTYFISKENEQSLMQPLPALFKEGTHKNELEIIHPLPKNQLIEVDSAGFGFLLMHRSIIEKIRKISPEYSLFAEEEGIKDKFIGEDIVFFRKLKKTGIKVYSHTGAVVEHMKRFSFDINYYNLYWNGIEKGLIIKY